MLFHQLQNLTFLGLTENRINFLEANIFQNLARLTEISLRSNLLESFDLCLFTQKVKILDLSLNQIKSVFCRIHYKNNMPSFSRISLAGNNLTDFPEFILNIIEDASYIDVSNNELDFRSLA